MNTKEYAKRANLLLGQYQRFLKMLHNKGILMRYPLRDSRDGNVFQFQCIRCGENDFTYYFRRFKENSSVYTRKYDMFDYTEKKIQMAMTRTRGIVADVLKIFETVRVFEYGPYTKLDKNKTAFYCIGTNAVSCRILSMRNNINHANGSRSSELRLVAIDDGKVNECKIRIACGILEEGRLYIATDSLERILFFSSSKEVIEEVCERRTKQFARKLMADPTQADKFNASLGDVLSDDSLTAITELAKEYQNSEAMINGTTTD